MRTSALRQGGNGKTDERAVSGEHGQEILDLMRDRGGKIRWREVYSHLASKGLCGSQASRILKRLEDRGAIAQLGRGVYQLADKETAEPASLPRRVFRRVGYVLTETELAVFDLLRGSITKVAGSAEERLARVEELVSQCLSFDEDVKDYISLLETWGLIAPAFAIDEDRGVYTYKVDAQKWADVFSKVKVVPDAGFKKVEEGIRRKLAEQQKSLEQIAAEREALATRLAEIDVQAARCQAEVAALQRKRSEARALARRAFEMMAELE